MKTNVGELFQRNNMSCERGSREVCDCWECFLEDDSSDALLTEAQTTLMPVVDLSSCYTAVVVEEGDEDL